LASASRAMVTSELSRRPARWGPIHTTAYPCAPRGKTRLNVSAPRLRLKTPVRRRNDPHGLVPVASSDGRNKFGGLSKGPIRLRALGGGPGWPLTEFTAVLIGVHCYPRSLCQVSGSLRICIDSKQRRRLDLCASRCAARYVSLATFTRSENNNVLPWPQVTQKQMITTLFGI